MAVSNTYPTQLIARPEGVSGKIYWAYLIPFVVFHAVLPLAFVPWFFSWEGLVLVPLGFYVFDHLGIGLCYHRLLTHKGLIVPKWLEHLFAVLGVCCLQSTPMRWVAIHRRHHQFSDQSEDPHSPRAGFFWGHMGWMIYSNHSFKSSEMYQKYVKDLLQDRFYKMLERNLNWFWVYVAHAVLIWLVGGIYGYAISGSIAEAYRMAMSFLLFGVIVRTVLVWHATWAVNSVAHRFGYRNFETNDDSRNSWWVAFLTGGEGWHNNHHKFQRSVSHGLKPWEIDTTYLTIRLLAAVGLAKILVDKRRGI